MCDRPSLRKPSGNQTAQNTFAGIQNGGIAVILLLLSLDHPESDRSIVAPVTSSIFTPIPLWIAVAVIKIRRHCCTNSTINDTTTTPESGTGRGSLEADASPGESLCKKLFGKGETGKDCCGYLCRFCVNGLAVDGAERKEEEEEEEKNCRGAQPWARGPPGRSLERNGIVVVEQGEAGGFDNLAVEHDDKDAQRLRDSAAENKVEGGNTEQRGSVSGVEMATAKSDHSTATRPSQVQSLRPSSCVSPSRPEDTKSSLGHETYL